MIKFDLNAIDDAITHNFSGEEVIDTEIMKDGEGNVHSILEKRYAKGIEINPIRFELINQMINTVMEFLDDSDGQLGYEYLISTAPISVKLAIQTLKDLNIIKIDE